MWISSRSDKNKKEKEERQAPVVEIVTEYMETRGWRNVEKRPTLAFFFSEPCLTPPSPYLPNIVCFFHIYVFGNIFGTKT